MQLSTAAKAQFKRNCRWFAEVRAKSGVSLREVGNQVGVHHVTVLRLEQGKNISAMAYVALTGWAGFDVFRRSRSHGGRTYPVGPLAAR